MRSTLVFAVALIAVGLMISNGAEPIVVPPESADLEALRAQVDEAGLRAVGGVVPQNADLEALRAQQQDLGARHPRLRGQLSVGKLDDNDVESLRQRFIELTNERAGQMSGPELKKAIAEMQMERIITSLLNLAKESEDDGFAASRAAFAARVLRTKDRPELEEMIRSVGRELEQSKAKGDGAAEPVYPVTPNPVRTQ